MSQTTLVRDARTDAADFIRELVERDEREQKDIAATAGISPGQVTHLKNGDRSLTTRMARRLAVVWPDQRDRLRELAEAIEDATLPGPIPGSLRDLILWLAHPSNFASAAA